MSTWLDALFGLLALVAGWGLRWLAQQRTWSQARRIARAELDSPLGTNDPEEAMERATVTVNKHRIKKESKVLRPGSHSDGNGHGHKTPPYGNPLVK